MNRRETDRGPPPPPPIQPRAWVHIVSGAGAGGVASFATCPLDVIKTRMQVQTASDPHAYKSITDGFRRIYHSEGPRGFFRGLGPNLLALLPTWAVYFASYEHTKNTLMKDFGMAPNHARLHILSAMAAGGASTCATTPLWLIKTRLMTQAKGVTAHFYSNSAHAAVTIVRQEGVLGLYKGLGASLLGVIHVGIQFPLYERLKSVYHPPEGSTHTETPTWVIMLSSAVSKVVASIAWYPHEVLRTRMQTQSTGPKRYHGVIHGALTIIRTEGLRAMYSGMGTNLVRVVPASVITLTTYETLVGWLAEFDTRLKPPSTFGANDRATV